jgi:hypothetical protein
MRVVSRSLLVSLHGALLLAAAAPAFAIDGVVLIDQNKALSGNVTPGDAPGFPVTITAAGSYRLSGNLTVPNADTTAIDIPANNVTLDLNGFSINGPVTCTIELTAVTCTPLPTSAIVLDPGYGVIGSGRNITVQNGTISGMGRAGVRLVSNDLYTLNDGQVVRDLVVSRNAGGGVFTAGTATRVSALRNRGIGIRASVVSDSVAEENSNGLSARDGGLITRSFARRNVNFGLYCLGFGFYSNTVVLGLSNAAAISPDCVSAGGNSCPSGTCP